MRQEKIRLIKQLLPYCDISEQETDHRSYKSRSFVIYFLFFINFRIDVFVSEVV